MDKASASLARVWVPPEVEHYISFLDFFLKQTLNAKQALLGSFMRFFFQRKLYIPVRTLREKGGDLTQPCDKNPYTHRTIQKATWQHKNATKNFDYTTIADRLRTVSWSNSSHPTGVVKPVYERSTFPLTATAV